MNPKVRIEAVLERFAQLHHKDIDLGLHRLQGLLAKFSNPHLRLPAVIHVAGTNGKGSTIAMVAAMARAQGLSSHIYTSPHLQCLNERFVVAGQQISDLALAELLERIEKVNDGAPATVFELLSAAMFVVFAETPADIAIIEVGLGGELDATNVLPNPVLSLITPISIEHTNWLGTDIVSIAQAKAGIIKKHCPVISAAQSDAASQVIEIVAERNQAPLEALGQSIHCYKEDGRLLWQNESQLLDLPLPALPGNWQIQNAGLAIAAAIYLGWSESAIAQGIQQTNWPGRLQRLSPFAPMSQNLELWLDGAHNPAAAQALAAFFIERNLTAPQSLNIILSLQSTKDIAGFMAPFLPLHPVLHVVPLSAAPSPISPEALAQQCRQSGLQANAYDSLHEALRKLPDTASRILITGSLVLVGEVLDMIKKNAHQIDGRSYYNLS